MISYLIKNCKIYENKGNSILVENNIIKNIGTNLKPVGKLPVIDLKNKYIYPGFTDAHLHSFTSSQMAKYVDLSNCKSDKELISTIEKFIKVNKIGNGKMVVGVKYAHDLVPTSKLLDYFKNNPIYIIRVCLHIAVANKLAIKLVKHVNNENGVYKEDAIIKYLEGLPPLSLKDTEKALFDYFHYLKAQGNTYLQSNDIDNPYKKSTVYKALLNLNKNNKLPVHIYEQVVARNENDVKQAIELIKTTPKTEKLTFYSVKLFADGSLGAKTAYMLKPYENSKNQGKLNHSTKEMYKMISLVNKARIPCAIHAIGDGAVEQVISCYERLSKIYARNTLIHVQTGNIKQYQRIKKLGLNICFQPQFISSEYPMVLERIGKAREKTSYALGSWTKLGINVSGGSDSPVELPIPLYGIFAAVTRTDLNDKPNGGWYKEQCISVKQAIAMYTTNAAYEMNLENELGKIKVGYRANFVALDKDLLKINKKDIKNAKVVWTS